MTRRRGPPDSHDRGLADTELCQLVADLIRERAGTAHEAHRARGEDLGGDDAHVRLPRRQDARAVRPDHRDAPRADVVVDAEHVVSRDALRDRDDGLDTGVHGLVDRVGGEARRDEHHRGIGSRLVDRVAHRVENRNALDGLAALSRRHAGDHVGAVGAVAERVKGAFAPGDALDDETRLRCRR